jgi:PPK2 family polyphosphate:nucleotide phosphotransferase
MKAESVHKVDLSPWRIENKATIHLDKIDTFLPDKFFGKADDLSLRVEKLSDKLNKLQNLLYASKNRAVLLVLQGMDTSGKDGVIRHVFSHVNPLGTHAIPFGAPTELEKSHDFLWRVHSKVPALGNLTIFNRSHYEDVLVTRVRGWIKKPVWEKRYEHIRNFESLLHDGGITILKCYLHISKQEQKKRLQARLDDPLKNWKLQEADFVDRKFWPEYQAAYQDAISATSTEQAPWYIVPADSKPERDYFIASLLVQTMENMNLTLPDPTFDVKSVKL